MTTVEIILALVVVALAAALLATEAARRRDRRQQIAEATARAERFETEKHHARADTTEALARERATRERAQADLHEARLQVAALEQSRDLMEQEAGDTPRRSIFRSTSSEVDPHDAERERSGSPRGS